MARRVTEFRGPLPPDYHLEPVADFRCGLERLTSRLNFVLREDEDDLDHFRAAVLQIPGRVVFAVFQRPAQIDKSFTLQFPTGYDRVLERIGEICEALGIPETEIAGIYLSYLTRVPVAAPPFAP